MIKDERLLLSQTFCIGLIRCARIKRQAGFVFNCPNGRKKNGFVYIKEGRIRYQFEGDERKELILSKGDMFFLPSGCTYTAKYEVDGTSHVLIDFDLLIGELPTELSKPVQLFIPDSEKLIHNASVHPDSTEIGISRELYFISKVYDLIRKSVLSLRNHKNKALAQKLSPALLFLSENYAENHPISHYAALCFMSETAFRRSFHEYTDMSPIEYRNKLRIEEADRLIRSGEYSVREAAESVGFYNASFFTKTYKSFFGHTPRESK